MRLISICVVLTCIACGQGRPVSERPEKVAPVRLTRKDGGYEAVLQFQSNRALLSLSIDPVRDKSGAKLPMQERTSRWRPLLAQFLKEQGRRKELLVAVGDYPELDARLASSAICSATWDPDAGAFRGISANAAAKEILGRERLAPEIESLFSKVGYDLTVDQVENVIVCPWSRIQPSVVPSCASTLKGSSKAPCGASILFRATRKE